MPVKTKPPSQTAENIKAMRALQIIEERVAFGPLFFMRVLRRFVHDWCPEPGEHVPNVYLHLMDGQRLALCNIIAIAPNWLALSVHDEDHPERKQPLRTEIVPYPSIARVTIEAAQAEGPIGFNTSDPSFMSGDGGTSMTPEEALRAVATLPPRKRAPRPRQISGGSRPASRSPKRPAGRRDTRRKR